MPVSPDNLMLRMSEQEWDDIMAVNLKSCFNITKHAIKPMMRAKKGSIINISSIVGLSGQAGQANYAASKAGIIGFTKSVAKELGSRNIRSNAIAPGFIQTDMTDELPENLKETYFKQIPWAALETRRSGRRSRVPGQRYVWLCERTGIERMRRFVPDLQPKIFLLNYRYFSGLSLCSSCYLISPGGPGCCAY